MNYFTVTGSDSAEFIEKKSRFIGYIKGVSSESEALAFIDAIRSRHYDATHNVYAYVLRENNLRRYSDDGEPQGTAGVPVLEVLLKEGIGDVAIVVTRYFGGTLLGAGGLVRAYSKAAKLALDKIGVTEMRLCELRRALVPYPLLSGVQKAAAAAGGTIAESRYGELVELIFAVPAENMPAFLTSMDDVSAGKLDFEKIDEKFFAAKKG